MSTERGIRRIAAPSILESHNIVFSQHNFGTHLVVQGKRAKIDFWPGTTRWIARATNETGFGIESLLKQIDEGAI